jgi:hypothetical protein
MIRASPGNFQPNITKLPAPFSRADLSGGWFTLTIGTDDVWVPDYFAVFGLNTSFGQTDMLIPFVHAPQISLEHMSQTQYEGWESNDAERLGSGLIVHPPFFGTRSARDTGSQYGAQALHR